MQKSQPQASTGGFGAQDVLFVLFKHKWMILLFSALGFGAAATVYFKRVPMYSSEAQLLVRYVVERGSVDPYQAQASPGGNPGDNVINTEIGILRSMDVALKVAETIGAGTLMPESRGMASLSDAARAIQAELGVNVGQSNTILSVTYGNPDRELSKSVLKELVNRYFEKHLEIHRSAAAFDMVAKQTEEVRERLKQTELQLNKLKAGSGIQSLADATGALSAQRARTLDDLRATKADFAERQASIEVLEKISGADDGAPNPQMTGRAAKGMDEPPPPQAITEYRKDVEMLAFLRKRDLELRIKFKPGNRLLALNQQQIDTYDAQRQALVAKFPNLAAEAQVVENDPGNPKWNLILEKARLAAIGAKTEVLETQMKEIAGQYGQQSAIGAEIDEMERKKQMEDAEYRSLEVKLKNAKIDTALNPSTMPNITVSQQPTEPLEYYNKKTDKLILGLAGGGMALGVGLAFMIELLFDRRIKRPIEIQARLQLPLLLSIPYIRRKDRGGLMLSHESGAPRIGRGGDMELPALVEKEAPESAVRKANHFILPYSETIRDRIIFNFEINNVIHKPKLVAVTGLSDGAGASTIAAGLAKSFSEIKGAKVLLVDLSSYHPEDNPMFGEIPRHSLDGALQLARNTKFKKTTQNLYYASATARRDDSGLTTFSPMHLYDLMPQLQASEFDYIIFDMPPVDQTSRTLTMAGMMDKVLLVLDAENTSRDALKWGYSELVKGKADVSCVFNKTRSHVPGWLIGEN